jgi:hypothetical protein
MYSKSTVPFSPAQQLPCHHQTKQLVPSSLTTRPTPLDNSVTLVEKPTTQRKIKVKASLSNILKQTTSPMATSFFKEHLQMREGMQRAQVFGHSKTVATPLQINSAKIPTIPRPLPSRWARDSKPSPRDKHSALVEYNKQYRGLNIALSTPLNGKYPISTAVVTLYHNFCDVVIIRKASIPVWKQLLSTWTAHHCSRHFGCPSKVHSNTQTSCFDTCIYPILMSGYLDLYMFSTVCHIHVLFEHLTRMIIRCTSYNFTWISYEDPFWKQQTDVPQSHAVVMLVALFHYRMHAPDVMQFLGGTYIGEHRDINSIVAILSHHDIDPWLIIKYVQATTVGSPNHFSANMSIEKMHSSTGERGITHL